MKSRILYIILFFLFKGVHAQQKMGLNELVLLAYKNNLSIKDAAIDSMKYEQAIKYNQYNYLPQVSAGLRNTYNWGLFIDPATNVLSNFSSQVYSFNIQSDWTLFDGGKNYYTGQMYEASKQISHQQYRQNLFELRNQITVLYYKYWQTDAQIEKAEKVQEDWELKLKKVKSMVSAGVAAAKELPHIYSYVELNKVNIAKLENQKSIIYRQIQAICYISDSLGISKPDQLSVSPTQEFTFSVNNFPIYHTYQSMSMLENHRINLYKSSRFPTAGIMAGWVTRSSSLVQMELSTQFNNNLSKYVAFYVNIPLFNKMQPKSLIVQSMIEQKRYQYKISQLDFEMRAKINQLKEQLKLTQEAYMIISKQIEYLKSETNLERKAFELGNTTYFELESAEERLEKAEATLLVYQYDMILYSKLLQSYHTKFVE